MVEIPELSKEEIQKTASEMFVGIMVGRNYGRHRSLHPAKTGTRGRG
jgi:hypothetical protein